jgi:hypothetical protein
MLELQTCPDPGYRTRPIILQETIRINGWKCPRQVTSEYCALTDVLSVIHVIIRTSLCTIQKRICKYSHNIGGVEVGSTDNAEVPDFCAYDCLLGGRVRVRTV